MEKKYYLYIKTSSLGLKYLGKTTKDPFTYMGSGKIWKRHIKKHNLTINDIKTEILFETNNLDELISKGLYLSKLYNVVESKEWANLRNESGDGGDTSKFIDFSNPIFHEPNRSKHLNEWLKNVSDVERKKILRERISNAQKESVLKVLANLLNNGKTAQIREAINKFRLNRRITEIQRNFLKRLLMSKAGLVVIGFKKWQGLPEKKDMSAFIKASKFEKGLSNFVDRTLKRSFGAFKNEFD
jgi:hypothetical protein